MSATSKDPSLPHRGHEKVVEVFGADLRSLALFRIVLALLVLGDLINRATDFYAHYTDEGVLPRTVLLEEALSSWRFSLNLANGEPAFQAFLFGATAVAALGMLVGYRTRLMTILVWVLVLSIQWRNPLILNSGDILLRLLLFWSMFLPLGAYWSVDRALKPEPARLSMRFVSFATVGLFMQIAFVYWFAVILQADPVWRMEGTAFYYALGADQFATRIGAYLYRFPELLKVLTFATVGLKAFGPFLLFSPFFTGPVRTATALVFMNLHIGIWLTMDTWLFNWTATLCMVFFCPSWFWDQAAKVRALLPERHNPISRLRLAGAHLVHAYWTPLRARLSRVAGAAQPPHAGVERLSLHPAVTTKTWRGEISPDTRATDGVEMQHGTPAGSGPTMLRSSLATNLLALLFLVYVFLWNLGGVPPFTIPERLLPPATLLGLDQYWGTFAPAPPEGDLWHVIPGRLRDGRQVDLLSVAKGDFSIHDLSWEKPPYVRDLYKNERWRRYLENLSSDQFANQRLYFGQYICREWNARHTGAEQLRTFEITYIWQPTYPDYEQGTPERVVLWTHSCF